MNETIFQEMYHDYASETKQEAIDELKKVEAEGFSGGCVVEIGDKYGLMLKSAAVVAMMISGVKIVY